MLDTVIPTVSTATAATDVGDAPRRPAGSGGNQQGNGEDDRAASHATTTAGRPRTPKRSSR